MVAAESVYHALWLPLQEMLTSSEFEELFWLDLVRGDARIKQADICTGQQASGNLAIRGTPWENSP